MKEGIGAPISFLSLCIKQKEKMNSINKHYKDRLFAFIFGNESHKEWALSLYNAINNTNYTDPNDLHFVTLDNFLYMGMRNDVGILCMDTFELFEHQSTFNPNLPIRMLLYASKIYERYIKENEINLFSSREQKIPGSQFYVFYNGSKEIDDRIVLKLNDLMKTESNIDVRVVVLNINHGRNQRLLKKCEELGIYSLFVNDIKKYQEEGYSLKEAIDKVFEEMDTTKELNQYLQYHRTEVEGMLFTKENEEWEKQVYLKEAIQIAKEEDREEAKAIALAEERKRIEEILLQSKKFTKEEIDELLQSSRRD